MKIFCIANQKGGVGKTTLARHTTFHASERHLRVLVVDLDPQGNLTRSLLSASLVQDGSELALVDEQSSAHLLFHPEPAPCPLALTSNISLLRGSSDLIAVLSYPIDDVGHARRHLSSLGDQFDLCIVDTPPTMSNLLFAGMICADFLVAPCDLDEDATSGLLDLARQAQVIQENFNPGLELLGVLLNKVNRRRAYDQAQSIAIRNEWGNVVLDVELQERSATKLAKKAPVWRNPRGESDRHAAKEMRAACEAIFTKIGL